MISAELRARLRESAEQTSRSGRPDPSALARLGGLLAAAVPRAYGGAGGDAADLNRIVEQLATVNPSVAILTYQHFAVASRIAEWGTSAQKAHYLPALADGTCLAASAWNDRGASAASRTTDSRGAEHADGTWVLDGGKTFTTGACVADLYMVQVNAEPLGSGVRDGVQRTGRTFFLVTKSTPGLHPELSLDLVGMRGSATGVVSLRHCAVPESCRLGPVGSATKIITSARESGATLGAVSVGIAQAALDHAADHAARQGVLSRPAVRQRLTGLATRLEAARGLVEWAGARMSASPDLATLHSKLFASTVAEEACLEATQILGSSGYLSGATLSRLLADARGIALMGPSNELCRQLLAVSWLGRTPGWG
ncbi:acyl-CoA dehydrogenase family protein [Streptomyces sp. YIM 130001]|uniref:acyl-CoA dehydrogenase family protein n=1 Tax=Streptomyces sp. YIM 130001 TaxID=2259644 RepID=UPI000E654D1D|nr:acyl-CoA dehydrogenase family protein [Streptomyces sp. YIM 130001]